MAAAKEAADAPGDGDACSSRARRTAGPLPFVALGAATATLTATAMEGSAGSAARVEFPAADSAAQGAAHLLPFTPPALPGRPAGMGRTAAPAVATSSVLSARTSAGVVLYAARQATPPRSSARASDCSSAERETPGPVARSENWSVTRSGFGSAAEPGAGEREAEPEKATTLVTDAVGDMERGDRLGEGAREGETEGLMLGESADAEELAVALLETGDAETLLEGLVLAPKVMDVDVEAEAERERETLVEGAREGETLGETGEGETLREGEVLAPNETLGVMEGARDDEAERDTLTDALASGEGALALGEELAVWLRLEPKETLDDDVAELDAVVEKETEALALALGETGDGEVLVDGEVLAPKETLAVGEGADEEETEGEAAAEGDRDGERETVAPADADTDLVADGDAAVEIVTDGDAAREASARRWPTAKPSR